MFLIILSGQLCEHVRYLDGHVHLFYIPGSDWVCSGDLTDSKTSKTHCRENWRFWYLWSTNTLWHIQCDLLVHAFFHMKFKLTIHISKESLYIIDNYPTYSMAQGVSELIDIPNIIKTFKRHGLDQGPLI